MLMTRRLAALPALTAMLAPTLFISGCGKTEGQILTDKLGKTKNEANKLEDALASMIYEQADNVSTILTTLILERDLYLEFPVRDKAKAQKISQEITSVRVNLDKDLFDEAKKRSTWYRGENLKRLVDLNEELDLQKPRTLIINDVLANSPECDVSRRYSDVKSLQKLLDLIREGSPIINRVLASSPEYTVLDDDLRKSLSSYHANKSNIGRALVILKVLIMSHDMYASKPRQTESLLDQRDMRVVYEPVWGFSQERLTGLGPCLTIFDSQ